MFSGWSRLLFVAAGRTGRGAQPGSDLHNGELQFGLRARIVLPQPTLMSPTAHPCRAILLVASTASALLLSALTVRADVGQMPAASSTREGSVAVVATNTASIFSVPEPGVLVSLAGGVGVLLGLQRFRRRA